MNKKVMILAAAILCTSIHSAYAETSITSVVDANNIADSAVTQELKKDVQDIENKMGTEKEKIEHKVGEEKKKLENKVNTGKEKLKTKEQNIKKEFEQKKLK